MVMVFKPIGDTGSVTSSLEPEPDAQEAADEIESLRECLRIWIKFWKAESDDVWLAEKAMEETRSVLKEK